MLLAKLSTDKTIVFGPVLDSAGAAFTTEVVGSVLISKNGAAAAALNGSATLTHSSVGVYRLLLKAADISEVGEVTVFLSNGTYAARPVQLNVLPATVYDALVTNAVNATGGLVGATGTITTMAGVIATTTNITAGTITTCTTATNVTTVNGLAAGVITAASIATDAIDSDAIAASAVTEIQSGLAVAATVSAEIAAEAVKTAAIKVKTDFLPSFAAGAAGGVFIAGANAATSITTALTANIIGNITGNLSGSIGSVATGGITTASFFAGATLPRVTLVDTTTTNTDMRGTDAAATAANLAIVAGYLDTEIAAIQTAVVTTIPAQITALNNISIANVSTGVTTALTTALTEGYRATNATGSVRDLLYEVLQSISEFTITSTTKTVKKLDGSTTAKTYTLNDATTPTGITETT